MITKLNLVIKNLIDTERAGNPRLCSAMVANRKDAGAVCVTTVSQFTRDPGEQSDASRRISCIMDRNKLNSSRKFCRKLNANKKNEQVQPLIYDSKGTMHKMERGMNEAEL